MKVRPINFRLDAATIRRAQALIPLCSTPGRPATRSDVYRILIITGLEVMEKSKPPSAKRRRGHALIRGEGRSSR